MLTKGWTPAVERKVDDALYLLYTLRGMADAEPVRKTG